MIKLSLAYTLDAMRRDNLNCWHLLDGSRELARQDDKEQPIEESLDALKDAVGAMSGDVLTVKATKAGAGAAKMRTFFVNLSTAGNSYSRQPSSSAPIHGPADLYQEIGNLKAELAARNVRDELQKRIDELERGSKRADWIEIIKVMAPHVGPKVGQALSGLIGTFTGTAPGASALAGPPEGEAMQVTMPTGAAKALQRLYEIDPDFSTVLVKFAALAEDRAKYTMLKGML